MIPLTRAIPRRISGLLLLSAIFILHNAYRIHLHRTAAIPLERYIAAYPLPLTARLHRALRARYAHAPFAVHLYAVPVWTLLALHQLLPRRLTWRSHAALGRALVACSAVLSVSAAGILRAERPGDRQAWGSFRTGSALFVAYWVVCCAGLRSSQHAFWGVQLVSVGFGTALLRVVVFLWLWLLGGVVDETRYERVLGVAMCAAVVGNPLLVWAFWGVRMPKRRSLKE